MTKIWITKYLFTHGIIEDDVNIEIGHRGAFLFQKPDGGDAGLYPGDYHLSEKDAIDKAWTMQAKKIVSLKEKIKEILDFETLIKNKIEAKND